MPTCDTSRESDSHTTRFLALAGRSKAMESAKGSRQSIDNRNKQNNRLAGKDLIWTWPRTIVINPVSLGIQDSRGRSRAGQDILRVRGRIGCHKVKNLRQVLCHLHCRARIVSGPTCAKRPALPLPDGPREAGAIDLKGLDRRASHAGPTDKDDCGGKL
jgi:hypothetical protein